MRFPIRFLGAFALAAGVSVAAENLTIVSKVARDGEPSGTTTSYLAEDRVRVAQADGHESIIDLKTGQMTVLDGKKRTYYTVTRQDLEQMKVRMEQQMNSPEMKKAQERMKSMTPEERKRMEGFMSGMAASFEVQKEGTTRRIAGYGCEDWTITVGALSRTKECLTTELQFPIHAWDTYREFAESMKNMATAFGPMAKSVTQMQEKLQNMKGFPLATATTIDIVGHTTSTTSEVIEVRRDSIPASVWEIPAGYTKVDNPMLRAFNRSAR